MTLRRGGHRHGAVGRGAVGHADAAGQGGRRGVAGKD